MTTLILSSIIALLVIAGASLSIARWMHSCSEQNRRIRDTQLEIEMRMRDMEPGQELECFIFIDGMCVGSVMTKKKASEYQITTSIFDETPMNQLIQDAKDILNKEA